MARIVGVVLAAGSGTRMGSPKAALVVDGQRLVDHAVAVLTGSGCAPVFVVARPGLDVPDARVVVNPEPARGMRSSLALGIEAAADLRPAAIAVLLVDVPGVSVAATRAVLAAWQPGRIAVARYDRTRGHPTVMAPDLWLAALDLAAPDEGARALLAARRELVDEVSVAGDPADLDTPDDLARWKR